MAIHIRRREFIVTLGSAAAAWPLAARAQQSAIPVVGYLGVASAQAEAYLLAAFRKGLSEAGFDEGRNVTIDYRFAERDVSRLPAADREHDGSDRGRRLYGERGDGSWRYRRP